MTNNIDQMSPSRHILERDSKTGLIAGFFMPESHLFDTTPPLQLRTVSLHIHTYSIKLIAIN